MKLLIPELLLFAVAAVIVSLAFRRESLVSLPRLGSLAARAAGEWTGGTKRERVIWLGVVLAAVAIRLHHMGQTMRNDEAYTYLAYASSPLFSALSNYEYPNNHLFHTLLVWVSTRLFGDSPAAIRLPAFIAGTLIVPAVYVVARTLTDRGTSLLAMALAAVWPSLILYSTNARGYSIIVLAFLGLLMLADRASERDEGWPWLASALVVAIGMYTAPVMLYPAGVAVLWSLAERARRRGAASALRMVPRVVAAGALAGVLTVMANLPVVLQGGLAPLISNEYVVALSFGEFVEALQVFVRSIIASCAFGVPRALLVVFGIAGIVGVVAPGPHRAPSATLAAAALLWSLTIMVVMRRPPPGRVMLFLVPLACVYIAIGAAFALPRVARLRDRRLVLETATCGLVLALGAYSVVTRSVFLSRESGTLVDAPQIAHYLLATMRPGDDLVVASPSGPPLDYYMVRDGGRETLRIEREAARTRVFVVVNRHEGQTLASVQTVRRDVAWHDLVSDGPPVSFAPGMVFVFRYAAGGLIGSVSPTAVDEKRSERSR